MSTVTTEYVEIAKVGDLKPGQMKSVAVQGREILLARVGEEYYAADNRCRHMGGKLSHGKLSGTVVTCPLHGSQFDLGYGHVVRWTKWSGLLSKVNKAIRSPRPLASYKVRVEGDRVLIEV